MSDTTVTEADHFIKLVYALPPEQREWFIDQMQRKDRGEPNVFDGTAPNPYDEQSEAA